MQAHTPNSESVADIYLTLLASRGVDYLFANAGTDFAPLIEALAKAEAEKSSRRYPTPLLVPHENVAVAMAHGYYMATGRVQAVMVHVTLGTANAINGIYNAARQNIPILFTAGRTPILESGLEGSRNNYINWAQELFDQAGMVRELVKWDYELRHPLQLETVVDRALALATSDPKGPVYLTLPREVLAASSQGPQPGATTSIVAATAPQADPGALAQLAQWIREARSPLLITSNAGRHADSATALDAIAQRLALPVVQYRPRYLSLPIAHPMHCGFDAAKLLGDADLILVLESDVPWIPDQVAPNTDCKIVHMGVDPLYGRYPIRGFRADMAITGEIGSGLRELDRMIGPADPAFNLRINLRRTQVAQFRAESGLSAPRTSEAATTMSSQWVTRCIDELCDADTVVINEYPLVLEELQRVTPANYFSHSPAGGLGWAMGAALGVKLAKPGATVIAAVGDGTYMFGNPTPTHFVSRACALPVLFIIFNNMRWGSVHRSTMTMYPDGHAASASHPPLSCLEPSPDFEKVIEASGGYGERVSDPRDLPAALQRALHAIKVENRQALLNVQLEINYTRTS